MRFVCATLVAILLHGVLFLAVPTPQGTVLPAQISDAEFWRIFTEFSEPGNIYPYENFVTNEETIQDVMPVLTKVTKPGGVYLGVGPEQNFTYISAVNPKMAFVFDIRRQNAIEHLMYKAIFEMSPTRADFVSRLFSIKIVDKAPTTARANALFLALDGLKADKTYYTENLATIKANLSKHGFALNKDDLQKVEYIYDVFFRAGPQIDYTFASAYPAGMVSPTTYVRSMTDTDADKKAWSFLASEENYQVVRQLQIKNLLVPIVGNFAGPTAIRKVADYIRQHNAIVSAFYLSNVEFYLATPGTGDGRLPGSDETVQRFYQNAATLPVDSSSLFIRFISAPQASNVRWWNGARLQALSPMIDVRDKLLAGSTLTYAQALQMIPDPKTLLPR